MNQGWTKGGKEERSFRDMDTIQIQKSGIGTGNTRSPGDGGLCWKEKRQELALSEYLISAGYSCDHNNPAKEVLSAPARHIKYAFHSFLNVPLALPSALHCLPGEVQGMSYIRQPPGISFDVQ